MSKFTDMTGRRFGRLTAITVVKPQYWRCQCDCGQIVTVYGADLRRGRTASCGCWRREVTRDRMTTHGAARFGRKTVEYRVWEAMMRRCYNPNTKDFKNYGGRGIKVCKRWHDFRKFLADMGLRPAGNYTIERINNDGDYKPSNCIWLPKSEQSKNQRRTNRAGTLSRKDAASRPTMEPRPTN